jgi:hypothetical protein
MSDCNTSVCGGQITFGPPIGDVSGLGYCSDCELSAQQWESDDQLVDELLFEDGAA